MSASLSSSTSAMPAPPAIDLTPPTSLSPTRFGQPGGLPVPPVTCPPPSELDAIFPGPDAADGENRGRGTKASSGIQGDGKMLLELTDGTAYEGFGFGADKSISGECVFQTGRSFLRVLILYSTNETSGSASASRLSEIELVLRGRRKFLREVQGGKQQVDTEYRRV